MPKPKTIAIKDDRKVSAASGKPVQDARTGDYDYEAVSNIIKAAKDEGVDPYSALAVALQESGLGSKHQNLGQVEYTRLSKNPQRLAEHDKAVSGSKDNTYRFARSLAFMLRTSGHDADQAGFTADKADEAQRLQAYNGYGKVGAKNDIGAKTLYGVDLTKHSIDMKKTPLYGKTIVDLRENIIKKNPAIKELVDANDLSPDELKGITFTATPGSNGKQRYQFRRDNQVVAETDGDPYDLKTEAGRGTYIRSLYLKAKNATNANAASVASTGTTGNNSVAAINRLKQVMGTQ